MVTLKQFMDICTGVIRPYLCTVLIEKQDEIFGKVIEQVKTFSKGCLFENVKELEPYFNYEITSLEQYFAYGEINEQQMYLKEVK